MSVPDTPAASNIAAGEKKGPGLIDLVEAMALVQRIVSLDLRSASQTLLLERVTESVLSYTGFEDCAVHLREDERWRCVARAGWRDLLAPDLISGASDREGDAARSGYGYLELMVRGFETVHIPDLGRIKTNASSTCGALICAPMLACGALYGALCVAHSEAHRFVVLHERLATLVAKIVAEKLLCHRLLMPAAVATRTPRAEKPPSAAIRKPVTETQTTSPQGSSGAVEAVKSLGDRVDLEEQLRRALKSVVNDGKCHALCVFDIDQLRVVNDTGGHDAGDELLRQIVDRVRAELRVDDLLVRLGGDEFGALIWDCPKYAAQGVVDALRRAVRQIRFQWRGDRFRVRASFGLVHVFDPRCSPSDLLSAADAACHGAKSLGGDRVHVFEKDDEATQQHCEDIRWVAHLNRALEDDSLVLHCQPIESVSPSPQGSRRSFGELLLRMRTSTGELVPAGCFLPAAERYGLSTRLDRRVVERALRWLRSVDTAGASRPMLWINLSAHSVSDPDFLETMIRTLRDSSVPGACLCFEITETAAIARMKVALRFIDTLREFGCRFALDDFGSGMSSFAYLKSMNVDYVKIDGTFVRDLLEDARSLALVRSMNEVAHALGKLTVAEWVETEAVREALRDTGVDYVQGFLIGRPKPLVMGPKDTDSST